MTFKEMTASDAMGLAHRAALDIWLFACVMTPDNNESAMMVVLDRIESSARGVLGWCRVKREELQTHKRRGKKR